MARRKSSTRRSTRQKPEVSGVTEIFHSRMSRAHSRKMHLAEFLTERFGTLPFLIGNLCFFGIWLLLNSGYFPAVHIFDPYPFVMLTTIVSLEAIALSIIVLISQNKASKLADLREQIDLQVNVQAEKEVTKILHILDRIQHQLGMKHVHDPELASMKKMLNLERLEQQVLEDMARERVEG